MGINNRTGYSATLGYAANPAAAAPNTRASVALPVAALLKTIDVDVGMSAMVAPAGIFPSASETVSPIVKPCVDAKPVIDVLPLVTAPDVVVCGTALV